MKTTSDPDVLIAESRGLDFFKNCTDEECRNLLAGAKIVVHEHRQEVFGWGEKASDFAAVLGGTYKLYRRLPSGEDSILHFSVRGEIIGALVLGNSEPTFPLSASALGSSRMIVIPAETYRSYWMAQPKIMLKLQSQLALRMKKFQSYKFLSKASLRARLSALLLELAAGDVKKGLRFSPIESLPIEIRIPLTRRELAETLGVAVETIIRQMSHWEKDGIVLTESKSITVLRPEILVEATHESFVSIP